MNSVNAFLDLITKVIQEVDDNGEQFEDGLQDLQYFLFHDFWFFGLHSVNIPGRVLA